MLSASVGLFIIPNPTSIGHNKSRNPFTNSLMSSPSNCLAQNTTKAATDNHKAHDLNLFCIFIFPLLYLGSKPPFNFCACGKKLPLQKHLTLNFYVFEFTAWCGQEFIYLMRFVYLYKIYKYCST